MDKVGADIFVTQKGVSNMLTSSSVIPNSLKGRLENMPSIKQVSPIYGTPFSFNVGNKKTASYLIGYDLKTGLGGPWSIAEGSSLNSDKQVVIDQSLAKNNGINLGDYVEISGDDFRVVGFSADTNSIGSQYIFVTKKDASNLMLAPDTVSYYLVKLYEPDKAPELAGLIERKLGGINAYAKDDFSHYNLQVIEEMILPPLRLMSVISFLIGVMVIGLTIYTATLAKINEYAVLKAIGARNSQLYSIVFQQSLISTIIGFLSGIAAAFGVAKIINYAGMGVNASLEPQVLIQSFLVSFFMSLVASFIPVKKVASIDPASVFK